MFYGTYGTRTNNENIFKLAMPNLKYKMKTAHLLLSTVCSFRKNH